MVIETPPDALRTIDDMWFHWVVDFGKPGADRGKGGRYLILPPDYDGPVPEGGFFSGRRWSASWTSIASTTARPISAWARSTSGAPRSDTPGCAREAVTEMTWSAATRT
jgi:hypothetical protein